MSGIKPGDILTDHVSREQNYLEQGRSELTPRQRRRVEKKARRMVKRYKQGRIEFDGEWSLWRWK